MITCAEQIAEIQKNSLSVPKLVAISVVDAWIAAAAMLRGATLLHKDPEFSALPIPQETLPLKSGG